MLLRSFMVALWTDAKMLGFIYALCSSDFMLAPFDVTLPRHALAAFEDTIATQQHPDLPRDTLWRAALAAPLNRSHNWKTRACAISAISAEMTLAAVFLSLLVSWYPVVVDGILFAQADPSTAQTVVLTVETCLSGHMTTIAAVAMFTWARTKWLVAAVAAELVLVAGTARVIAMVLTHAHAPSWFEYVTSTHFACVIAVFLWRCAAMTTPFLAGSAKYMANAGHQRKSHWLASRAAVSPFFDGNVLDQPTTADQPVPAVEGNDDAVTPVASAMLLSPQSMSRLDDVGSASASLIFAKAYDSEARSNAFSPDGGTGTGSGADLPQAAPNVSGKGVRTPPGTLQHVGDLKDATEKNVMESSAADEQPGEPHLVGVVDPDAWGSSLSWLSFLPTQVFPPEVTRLAAVAAPDVHTSWRSELLSLICDPLHDRPSSVLLLTLLLFTPPVINIIVYKAFTFCAFTCGRLFLTACDLLIAVN